MTIDEAIKILTGCAFSMDLDNRLDDKDAIKLGVEALKAIQIWRDNGNTRFINYIPGETKD